MCSYVSSTEMDEIEELSCMVITFITPFRIHVQEKCIVVKMEDTTPSCTINLVSVKKHGIIVDHLPGKISQMCILFSERITSS